ncbi:MAG TPA: regulatory protein RecX [Gemmatimonadaceae bacterium]|nr:regulatory protein RecX [Gemmatimonadaceae bacterium]
MTNSTVTAIVASPRRQGRFELLVDGKSVATLSLEAIERLRLQAGIGYDEALALRVEHEARALHVFDRALDLLAVRGRAARELRRALVRKGEEPEHVDAAIERLLALGLLDDAAYARQFARSKLEGAGLSRRRLQAELSKRGVAREVADDAIADVLSDDEVDQEAILKRVAARKLRTLRRLAPEVRRRRLYAFLARRGYEPDDIRRAMDALGDDVDIADVEGEWRGEEDDDALTD